MRKKKYTQQISISLYGPDLRSLNKLSEDLETSRSEVVRRLIRQAAQRIDQTEAQGPRG